MRLFYNIQKRFRQIVLPVVAMLLYGIANAQVNIIKAEYFIDTDPGFGAATNIPIPSNQTNLVNQVASVNLASISNGIHNFFIRTKDANGKWSITNRQTFFKTSLGSSTLSNIIKAEYFIDTDPGFGSAVNIPIPSNQTTISNHIAAVNLSAVNEGIHNLFIRTKDANGKWSVTNRQTFFKTSLGSSTLSNIVKAEYFIDADPGFGLGVNIPIPSNQTSIANHIASVNLSGVGEGIHNLFIRTKDANGKWSVTNRQTFFKTSLASSNLSNIVKAEYFIDTDPGFGAAVNIPIPSNQTTIANHIASVNLSGVSEGIHNLFIRTKDANGKWSVTNRQTFFKTVLASANLSNIVKAEYFIDTDPGFGLGINIPVPSNQTNIADHVASINLSGVSSGAHNLFIRTKDANGKWSVTNRQVFFKTTTVVSTPADLVKAEYFIDFDPGFGAGKPITIPTGSKNINGLVFPVSIGLQPIGLHYFFIRSLDASGKWSITNTDTFRITTAPTQNIEVGLVPSAICANATLNIPFEVGIPAGAGNIFTAQLSDAIGNFNAPINIGTLASTVSGNIAVTIPAVIASGSNYRVRIVASNPTDTSLQNDEPVTINNLPLTAYSINGPATTCTEQQNYSITVPEAGVTYNWAVTGGGSLNTLTGTTNSVDWPIAGKDTISVVATNGCGSTSAKILEVIVTAPVGDTAVSPTNAWNFYAFNDANINLSGLDYRGSYNRSGLNIKTTDDWSNNSSPSSATGYTGCAVAVDNFTVVAKRTGFDPGFYTLNINGHDDAVRVYVNGVQVFEHAACCDAHSNITLGNLDANSKVEIRFTELGSQGYLDVSFVKNALLEPGSINGNQSGCAGFTPALITSTAEASGGSAPTINYVWQQSDDNILFTDIPSATGSTYQPPVINADIYFRRKAYNANSETAFSNSVFMNVTLVTPAVILTANDSSVCIGSSVIFTAVATNGGTAPQYNFKVNNISVQNSTANTFTLNDPVGGSIVNVVLTANNSCQTTPTATSGEITVSVNDFPIINAGNDTLILAGGVANLMATGGATYLWSTGNTDASLIVSPNITTIYTVTGTSLVGCSSTDAVTVTITTSLKGGTIGSSQTLCNASIVPALFTNIQSASGGLNPPGITYQWQDSAAGSTWQNINLATSATYQSAAITVKKYFRRIATDGIGGTAISNIIVVDIFSAADLGTSEDVTICNGESTIISAFGGGTYGWIDGPNTPGYLVSPTSTQKYFVNITDANGCSTKLDSVTVFVNPTPVANVGPDQSMLRGSSVTLTASGGDNYLWNNGATTASITVSPFTTTAYSCRVTTLLNCSDYDTVIVTVNVSSLDVTPGIYAFGGVVFDSTATMFITITNNGTLTESVSSINGLTAPFSTTFTTPLSIPAGQTVQVPVNFTPPFTLFYQNKFTIVTSVGNFDISLTGRGVNPAPAWTITPINYNYGNVPIGSIANKDFIISNKGNIPVNVTTISSSSLRFSGTITGNRLIPVGGSIVMSLKFTPNAIASYVSLITVRTNTTGLSAQKINVAGSGYVEGALPQLVLLSNEPYNGVSGVTPAVGQAGAYTYTVIYKHPDGVAPMADFPKVAIDKNGDKDFVDEGEGLFTLIKQSEGTDWLNGEVFTFVAELNVSELYGYQFFATDSLGNPAVEFEYIKGPLVTREVLDLHIFASDIVFSKMNPAVNESFTVTATIHNNSPYATANVPVRIYYKDSIFLSDEIIPFIDGRSQVSFSKTLSFAPDGFYPIKIWIDSSNTLGEGNLLNNYATRPVIVGHFTVPGTIDVIAYASPSGCNRGKVMYNGSSNYRGLNLEGTPPVEGATVTITIANYDGAGDRILTTHTDINGNWSYYDDPCAQDVNPQDCFGYACGIIYNYTVEVTDFTLTSPATNRKVSRPCVQCNRIGRITHGAGFDNCILQNQDFSYNIGIANFEIDQGTGQKICAPTVYKDTIDVYVDGVHKYQYTLDSIAPCGSASYQNAIVGFESGEHILSFTHSYYNAANERFEAGVTNSFTPAPRKPDVRIDGINRAGYQSVTIIEGNGSCFPAGANKIYLYDSLESGIQKILIDSFIIENVSANYTAAVYYTNPNWEIGCHHLTAVADVDNDLDELKENNNIGYGTICIEELFPDITLGGLSISNTDVVAGTKVNFSVTLDNKKGRAPVDIPFKVQFKVNGIPLGNKINVIALAVNETMTLYSDVFTIPTNSCPMQITAIADLDETVTEYEEIKNNRDTFVFGININAGRSCDGIFTLDETVGAAGLHADSITYCIPFTHTCIKILDPSSMDDMFCFPYMPAKGILTRFETTVRNRGSRDAKNVKVKFTWDGKVIGTDVIPWLKAGERRQDIGFYYAFDTVGNFVVNAYADYDKEICETSESDNIGNIHIAVGNSVSDLLIYSQHIAPSNLNPDPGQSITVVASIINVGNAPSTPCNIRFWVNGIQLGVDVPIDSLYPGQDTTVMATLTYSSDIVGLKVIKVLADVGFSVVERNKGNNEATRSIIVGGAPDHAHSLHEAITIAEPEFVLGDSIVVSNYLRNYGGDEGTAWLRFSIRDAFGVVTIIDSVLFHLESNDSTLVSLKLKVTTPFGMLFTEILHSNPPEFDVLNNLDSLEFATVVPVKMISFTGKVAGVNAIINWQTTNEYNISRYEIQRSADGINFVKIGTIASNSNALTNSYLFEDNATLLGNNYYRIKTIETNGNYAYSKIVLLTINRSMITAIYPNPVKDELKIKLFTIEKTKYTLEITDVLGRKYMDKNYELVAGHHLLNVDVSDLITGLYFVKLFSDKGQILAIQKILKE